MPELNKQLLSGGIFPLQQGGVCRSLLPFKQPLSLGLYKHECLLCPQWELY